MQDHDIYYNILLIFLDLLNLLLDFSTVHHLWRFRFFKNVWWEF